MTLLQQPSDMTVSVLVPIHNEEESIPLLMQKLSNVMEKAFRTYEIILVDDGSSDQSWAAIQSAFSRYANVVAVRLQRNYGQTAAIQAGIENARYEVIVPMDADLQNDPADIPLLVGKLSEGYDVVSGWRKDRQDARIKRNFLSAVANKLISWTSGLHLHDYGCSLKAYRTSLVKHFRLYGEMHRFIPLYASWEGARITEQPVTHHPRQHGVSKYGLERTLKVCLDLLVVLFLQRFFTRPIYLFGTIGVASVAAGCISTILALYYKFFEDISLIQTPLPTLSVLFFLVGIVSILLGLLAEIIMRTYFESQGRAAFRIAECLRRPLVTKDVAGKGVKKEGSRRGRGT